MSELISLIFKFDLEGLFLRPSTNGLIQFFRYAFVGAIASFVDWGVLWGVEWLGLHYLLAAIVSFFAGLATNFFLSKKLVFNAQKARVSSFLEFVSYGAIGAIGLLLTLGIMYALTEWAMFHFMISKIIATALVLIWNFLARKILLYKK